MTGLYQLEKPVRLFFVHTCTNAMYIFRDCLKKVILNQYVASALIVIKLAMTICHFFLDLDFGAVSEISDCPANAGITTLDSVYSNAFESTWYAILEDYRNSHITMKQKKQGLMKLCPVTFECVNTATPAIAASPPTAISRDR
jgi:hypothetical protein